MTEGNRTTASTVELRRRAASFNVNTKEEAAVSNEPCYLSQSVAFPLRRTLTSL